MRENDYHEKKVISVMRSSKLYLLLFFFLSFLCDSIFFVILE